MTDLDYKEGRGDYYLAEGKRADTPTPETPRTEAGRETLKWFTDNFDWGADEMLLDIEAIEREAAAPAHKHDPDACADCFDMITEEMTVSD